MTDAGTQDFLLDLEGEYHGSIAPDSLVRGGSVRIEGGCLVRVPGNGIRRVEPGGAKMLEDFAALAEADDAHLVRFAKRWGPLGLCGHDLPRTHPVLANGKYRDTVGYHGCEYARRSPFRGESTDAWRRWANEARRILQRLADRPSGPIEAVERWWVEIETWVETWIVLARVHPRPDYLLKGRPRLVFSSDLGALTLFGALGVQLMYAVLGGGHGLRLCDNPECTAGEDGARRWYTPRRSPGNRRGYCDVCSADQRVARRLAQRDFRERHRADPNRQRLERGRAVAGSASAGR